MLGLLASVALLARMLPQPVRLWRTRLADGVSPLAAMNSVIADAGWLVYGLSVGLVPVWGMSALVLIPGVWTAALLVRVTTRRDLTAALAWLAVVMACGLSGHLGAVLALSVAVIQGPQVTRALRRSDLAGIAPATYWLSLADAGLWGAYGVAVGDGALVGYGVVLAAAAVTVLVRLALTRPMAPLYARPA